MSNRSCCVINCKHTSNKNNCKFYKFPVAKWKINQRNKWIAAVRRNNTDGSPWCPKPHDYICSDHFIGGNKSEEESSPSYAPTIFPSIYKATKVNESSALSRHKRFMERRIKKKLPSTTNTESTVMESVEIIRENPPVSTVREFVEIIMENPPVTFFQQKVDQECQVNFYSNSDINSQTFICNRYVNNEICHVETQTQIVEDTRSIKIARKKKFVNKECGTPHKTSVNQETQTSNNNFTGFASITNSEQPVHLAGLKFEMIDDSKIFNFY